MCCTAEQALPPNAAVAVVYDHAGALEPLVDNQAERVDWVEAWARVHGLAVVGHAVDDAAGATFEGMRPAFEHALELLAERGDAVILVHRPASLDPSPMVRAVLAARCPGRIVATTGEPVAVPDGAR